MIDQILAEETEFDFRRFSAPTDPLAQLFPSWIAYYRLKYAIAKILRPRSILEIGVRFGYSARTFLEAAPDAQLVGIDLDSDQFGGRAGAIEWARKITADFDATFVVADTQKMARLPGGIYDLIHVDGQQDGFGTFHDLRLAVSQARWVLLDGYFWTRDNLLNATDFVAKYRQVIQAAYIIPGYAGELLLRVSGDWLRQAEQLPDRPHASSELVPLYDQSYYLTDCGGYQEFRDTAGMNVSDPRLLAMLALSRLAPPGEVLDLGCGRGEITCQLARSGRTVTAIDYSADAIELAKKCIESSDHDTRERVTFICGDVTRTASNQKFSAAIAGDLIEHITSDEVSQLFHLVARQLEPTGIFIIHTFPNLWWYRHGYRRKRDAAAKLGAFLPAEPRSRYELLMHINEQTPVELGRQLKSVFQYVHIWVGNPEVPGEQLLRQARLSDWINGRDIYALASHAELDLKRAKALLSMLPLQPPASKATTLTIVECPEMVKPNIVFSVNVSTHNNTTSVFSSFRPNPIYVSYHWFRKSDGSLVVFDGLRTPLPIPLLSGEAREVWTRIESPGVEGEYRLVISLVQEGQFWFDSIWPESASNKTITVRR